MSLDHLRRRLDRIEAANGTGKSRLGRLTAVQIVTRSDEDRGRQLAALAEAGEYEPDRFVIERRIVEPDPRMKELWDELRRDRPPVTAH